MTKRHDHDPIEPVSSSNIELDTVTINFVKRQIGELATKIANHAREIADDPSIEPLDLFRQEARASGAVNVLADLLDVIDPY